MNEQCIALDVPSMFALEEVVCGLNLGGVILLTLERGGARGGRFNSYRFLFVVSTYLPTYIHTYICRYLYTLSLCASLARGR